MAATHPYPPDRSPARRVRLLRPRRLAHRPPTASHSHGNAAQIGPLRTGKLIYSAPPTHRPTTPDAQPVIGASRAWPSLRMSLPRLAASKARCPTLMPPSGTPLSQTNVLTNHAGGHHRRSPHRVEPCHPGHHPAAEVSEDDDGGRGGRKDGELTAERHARQRGEHECGYAREPTAFWNDGGHTRRQPARRSALVRAELTQWNGQSVTRRGIRGTPPQIPARSCERSLLRRT